MNNHDERDYGEEAANRAMLADEHAAEADTQVTAWGETGTYQHDADGNRIYRMTECGTCHRTWNDALSTSRTPVPAGRCPFEADHPAPPVQPFLVKAGGRIFRITPGDPFPEARNPAGDNDWFSPVDCRDLLTRAEAQSIVEDETAADRGKLIADEMTRGAVGAAYEQATALESGRGHLGATSLPDGFAIEIVKG